MASVWNLTLVEFIGEIEQLFVAQNVERRFIHRLSFLVAPMPEGTQDRAATWAEVGIARNPPQGVWVALAGNACRADGFFTGLLKPLVASEFA